MARMKVMMRMITRRGITARDGYLRPMLMNIWVVLYVAIL
jgi:hypothetical protein